MTKKDFIALADAFRDTREAAKSPEELVQWRLDMASVSAVLAASNPRFNRERWIGYIHGTCGPNGGTVKAA